MDRLEEIKKKDTKYQLGGTTLEADWKYLIQQAEKKQELELRTKELEYASKYNGKLNEFLQKRKLPPNTLGRHVVDVVMDYVQELEEEKLDTSEFIARQNNSYGINQMQKAEHYKQALEEIESRALQEINLGGQLDPDEVVEIVRQYLQKGEIG